MRSARVWVVIPVIVCLAALTWLQSAYQYVYFSAFTSGVSVSQNVHYVFFADQQPFLMLLFSLGIVAFACDLHRRESIARIDEVILSKTPSNFILVVGRVLGIAIFSWICYVALIAVALAIVLSMRVLGVSGMEIPQLPALLRSCFIHVPLNFLLLSALIASISFGTKSAIISMVLGIALVLLQYFFLGFIPAWVAASFIPELLLSASDLDPELFAFGLFKHLALLGLTFCLIVVAGIFMQRNEDASPRVQLGICGVVFTLSIALIVIQAVFAYQPIQERNQWREAHARFVAEHTLATYQIDELSGQVTIDPSRGIEAIYSIEATIDQFAEPAELVFVLNPGLTISDVRLNGNPVSSNFTNGLLSIDLKDSVLTDGNMQIQFACRGDLDMSFGYLSTEIGMFGSRAKLGNQPLSFGQKFSILNENSVALMPTSAFYPQKAPGLISTPSIQHRKDFFDLNLSVQVPRGWYVAGGVEQPLEAEDENATFVISPSSKVHEFALIADEYHIVTDEIEGIEFNLLVYPGHTENLQQFGSVWPAIREEISRRLQEIHDSGLKYPYSSFSVVEVPATLRLYRNEFGLSNLQTLPGIFLMRERDFPTAVFEDALKYRDSSWDDEYFVEAQTTLLSTFMVDNQAGGNVFRAYVQNLFSFQKSATGSTAIALDTVMEKLVRELIGDDAGNYYPRQQLSVETTRLPINFRLLWLWIDSPTPRMGSNRIHLDMERFENQKTWDVARSTSLNEIETLEDAPLAWSVLNYKTSFLADAIVDQIGTRGVSQLLSELLSQTSKEAYTLQDVINAGREFDQELDTLLKTKLFAADLPGFRVSEPQIFQIDDSNDDCSGYLVRLHVHNGEETPGFVSIDYSDGPPSWQEMLAGMLGGGGEGTVSIEFNAAIISSGLNAIGGDAASPNRIGPVHIDGLQSKVFNLSTPNPVNKLRMDPYLSLNKNTLPIDVPEPSSDEILPCEERPKYAMSDWLPSDNDFIVIDDLDEGFSVDPPVEDPSLSIAWISWFKDDFEPRMDNGLPVMGVLPSDSMWSRRASNFAFGRYRQTTAQILPKPENADKPLNSTFRAELPQAGTWNIDFHLPTQKQRTNVKVETRVVVSFAEIDGMKEFDLSNHGVYKFQLLFHNEIESIEFDASSASGGWNSLGQYDLPAAPVELRVLNENTGSVVFADAVRFQYINNGSNPE